MKDSPRTIPNDSVPQDPDFKPEKGPEGGLNPTSTPGSPAPTRAPEGVGEGLPPVVADPASSTAGRAGDQESSGRVEKASASPGSTEYLHGGDPHGEAEKTGNAVAAHPPGRAMVVQKKWSGFTDLMAAPRRMLSPDQQRILDAAAITLAMWVPIAWGYAVLAPQDASSAERTNVSELAAPDATDFDDQRDVDHPADTGGPNPEIPDP